MIPGTHDSGAIKKFQGFFASNIVNRYSKAILNFPIAEPIKLFSLADQEFFHFFAVKLGNFIMNDFFLYVTTTPAKMEKNSLINLAIGLFKKYVTLF